MIKTLMTAAVITVGTIGAASAAPFGGLFSVEASNVTNINSNQSQATISNFMAARADTLGGLDSVSTNDDFTYDGLLDFAVGFPQTATQEIDDWLATGTGSVGGLDPVFGDLQLSFPNINNGTAETTFFLFTRSAPTVAGTFTIRHDDGVAVYEDGVRIGGLLGPNSVRTTVVDGYQGGELSFLYVATNGNPSIFEVDFAPVPVPAALPLLLAGVGGLAFLRRRKKA